MANLNFTVEISAMKMNEKQLPAMHILYLSYVWAMFAKLLGVQLQSIFSKYTISL